MQTKRAPHAASVPTCVTKARGASRGASPQTGVLPGPACCSNTQCCRPQHSEACATGGTRTQTQRKKTCAALTGTLNNKSIRRNQWNLKTNLFCGWPKPAPKCTCSVLLCRPAHPRDGDRHVSVMDDARISTSVCMEISFVPACQFCLEMNKLGQTYKFPACPHTLITHFIWAKRSDLLRR